MTPEDVRKYFKSGSNLRRKTGMSHNNLYNWLKSGYVPKSSQYKLEKITNGKLTANPYTANKRYRNKNVLLQDK